MCRNGAVSPQRFDGSGYPGDIGNGHVPLGARILAIADAWDAMTSDRTYRKRYLGRSYQAVVRAVGTNSTRCWRQNLLRWFRKNRCFDQKQSGRVHNDLLSVLDRVGLVFICDNKGFRRQKVPESFLWQELCLLSRRLLIRTDSTGKMSYRVAYQ